MNMIMMKKSMHSTIETTCKYNNCIYSNTIMMYDSIKNINSLTGHSNGWRKSI